MTIIGSQYIGQILHIISQSLSIPSTIILIGFVILSVTETGSIIGEMFADRGMRKYRTKEFLSALQNQNNTEKFIEESSLPSKLKAISMEFLKLTNQKMTCQQIIAENILAGEEDWANKKTEVSELIAKMGPLVGLMGTLIPLGPALVGLSQGDFATLAQNLVVSFDSTIVGILAGGVTFVVAKVRRRWYNQYLADLDSILETIINVREDEIKREKKFSAGGRSEVREDVAKREKEISVGGRV